MYWLTRTVVSLLLVYLAFAAYSAAKIDHLRSEPTTHPPGSPVIYEGIPLADLKTVQLYRMEEQRGLYYPWTSLMDPNLLLILLALASGYFGGIGRDAFDAQKSRTARTRRPNAWLGLLIGPLLLGVSCAVPAIVVEGDWQLRLPSLIGICILGGLFSEQVYPFMKQSAKKIFGIK